MRTLLILSFLLSTLCANAKWLTYEDCVLADDKFFDGDSFQVKADTGYTYIFRLYGVDCAETDERFPDRLKEQAKEFEIPVEDLVKWGEKAKKFTKRFLKKPFTVHTEKKKARGSSGKSRYYAIIINADGKRLDEALVEAGLARAFGVGAEWPERTDPERFLRKLRSLEHKAKKNEQGIWEK